MNVVMCEGNCTKASKRRFIKEKSKDQRMGLTKLQRVLRCICIGKRDEAINFKLQLCSRGRKPKRQCPVYAPIHFD